MLAKRMQKLWKKKIKMKRDSDEKERPKNKTFWELSKNPECNLKEKKIAKEIKRKDKTRVTDWVNIENKQIYQNNRKKS